MGRSISAKNRKGTATNDGIEDLLAATIVGPSHIDKQRMVMLYGTVDENMIGNVIANMIHLSHVSPKPITLIISTYGGSVDELYSLYDVMKFIPCEVQTVGIGKVQSAGCHLLAAGAKGKRLVSASTRLMLHPVQLYGGFDGNIFQAQQHLAESQKTQDRIVATLVKETGTSLEKIEAIMKLGHDYYIGASEAIELGLADQIIGE